MCLLLFKADLISKRFWTRLNHSVAKAVCELSIVHPQGVYTLCPYIRARIINISVDDVKVLLTQENPFLSKLGDDAHKQAKKLGQCLFSVIWKLCSCAFFFLYLSSGKFVKHKNCTLNPIICINTMMNGNFFFYFVCSLPKKIREYNGSVQFWDYIQRKKSSTHHAVFKAFSQSSALKFSERQHGLNQRSNPVFRL